MSSNDQEAGRQSRGDSFAAPGTDEDSFAWAAALRAYVGADSGATPESLEQLYLQKKMEDLESYRAVTLGEYLGTELAPEKLQSRVRYLKSVAPTQVAARHTLAAYYRRQQKVDQILTIAPPELSVPLGTELRPIAEFLLFEVEMWALLDYRGEEDSAEQRAFKLKEGADRAATQMRSLTNVGYPFALQPATHLYAILIAEAIELADLALHTTAPSTWTAWRAESLGTASESLKKVIIKAEDPNRGSTAHARYYDTYARLLALQAEYWRAAQQISKAIAYQSTRGTEEILTIAEFRARETDIKSRWTSAAVAQDALRAIAESSQSAAHAIEESSENAQEAISSSKGEFIQLLGLLAAVIAFVLLGGKVATSQGTPISDSLALIGGSFGLISLGLIGWVLIAVPVRRRWDSSTWFGLIAGTTALVVLACIVWMLLGLEP